MKKEKMQSKNAIQKCNSSKFGHDRGLCRAGTQQRHHLLVTLEKLLLFQVPVAGIVPSECIFRVHSNIADIAVEGFGCLSLVSRSFDLRFLITALVYFAPPSEDTLW